MIALLAVVIAGSELSDVKIEAAPTADAGGVTVPLQPVVGLTSVRVGGGWTQVRCRLVGTSCVVVSGPLADQAFPVESSAGDAVVGGFKLSLRFPQESLPGVAEGRDVVFPLSYLAPALARSDLTGATAWSAPVELRLVIEGPLRWREGDPGVYAEGHNRRVLTVAPADADAWRCSPEAGPALVAALRGDPDAGSRWLTAAAAVCPERAAELRQGVCAWPAADAAVVEGCPDTTSERSFLVKDSAVVWVARKNPAYPRDARRVGGSVQRCVADARVGADGRVESADVSGCLPVFEQATREAVMAWRARPYLVDGRAVPFRVSAALTFATQ